MSLEKKRKQLELSRVEIARKELEFKIEEREDDIRRLKEYIQIQLNKEQELKKEIEGL